MTIKRNLIANGLGQMWAAAMGLVFTPLYIRYMGMEAYGLVGIFVVMQAWLIVLDMGLVPTLNREMARFTAGAITTQFVRDLLRTVECLIIIIAGMIVLFICAFSGWLANSWLQIGSLDPNSVVEAIMLSGCVIALRLMEGIYRSCLVGMQRQVLFNAISAITATIRWLGAAIVLANVSPSIEAFFLWQCLSSVLSVGLLAYATYRAFPVTTRGRFSIETLRQVWRFAGGVMGIALLSLLLTQADKVLLSKLLNLAEFGEYSLAVMVAGVVHICIVPITQAWYPRFCELYALKNQEALVKAYHLASQTLIVIVGSGAIVLIVFSETVLQVWTQDVALAKRVAVLVSLLTLGNLLNAITSIPHQAQLAHGWPALAVRINIVLIIFLLPAMLFVVPQYRALGAAWIWVGLNTAYLFGGVALMFRRILIEEKWVWYLNDVLFPLILGFGGAFFVKWTMPKPSTLMMQLIQLLFAAIITLLLTGAASSAFRKRALHILAK